MSVEAFTWALNAPVGGNLKIILMGIANHAHPDGTEAYPSLDTLAGYACCHRNTARRNVRELLDAEWIFEDGKGPKGQAKYRLPLGYQNGAPVPGRGYQNGPEGGTTALVPEPSIEPSNNDSLRSSLSSARALAATLNEKGQATLGALIEVAEVKRPAPFNAQSLVESSRKYRDRDVEAEAEAFRFWYLEGNGENVPVVSLPGRWTTWLKRAPSKAARSKAVRRPGRQDEERAERLRKDLEAIAKIARGEA